MRLAAAFERELGVRRDVVPDGEAAGERHGAVVTLLELADDLVRADPTAGYRGVPRGDRPADGRSRPVARRPASSC